MKRSRAHTWYEAQHQIQLRERGRERDVSPLKSTWSNYSGHLKLRYLGRETSNTVIRCSTRTCAHLHFRNEVWAYAHMPLAMHTVASHYRHIAAQITKWLSACEWWKPHSKTFNCSFIIMMEEMSVCVWECVCVLHTEIKHGYKWAYTHSVFGKITIITNNTIDKQQPYTQCTASIWNM